MFTAGLILAVLALPLNGYIFARLIMPQEYVHGRILGFCRRQIRRMSSTGVSIAGWRVPKSLATASNQR